MMDSRLEPFLSVYDLQGDSVMARFGAAGPGPGELLSPDMIDVSDATPTDVWVLQANRRLLTHFRLDSVPSFIGQHHYVTGMALDAVAMVDGGILAIGTARDSAAAFLGDSSLLSMRGLGRAPYRPDELPDVMVFDANWSAMAVSRSLDRVAIAFRYAPQLLVMDTLGHELARWQAPDGIGLPRHSAKETWLPNFSFDSSDVAFTRVAVSGLGVFAVHCGCRGSELNLRDSISIQLYRWGNGYVGEFNVPAPVTAIAASKNGQMLYVATENPEPRVLGYRVHVTAQAGGVNR